MKLRLTCWAEGLRSRFDKGVFVIVTCLHKEPGMKPTVLGQTESIASSSNPDWTKSFTLDYELGQEQHLILTLQAGTTTPIGSTLFEVGQVLGNGGMLAKELKDSSGVIAVRIEECKSLGQVQIQVRGLNLKNLDGIGFGMNKSDPFFELQRKRLLSNSNKLVWDTVYRSITIDNDLNPIFPEFFIDLDELSGGSTDTKFRFVMYDYDKQGCKEIGSGLISVNDLVDSVNDTALQPDPKKVDASKALPLKVGSSQEETGKLIVIKAVVSGVLEETTIDTTEKSPIHETMAVEQTVEILDVASTEIPVDGGAGELEVELSDETSCTFCNYVAGGCQLRVICAIDATASNGDPRQESSLHYFNDRGLNSYENALQAICSIVSQYDSDQMFPVYGFGAKVNGTINHCFPLGSAPEVDGVDGILKVYRDTFRSGILLSSPRDFSEVIRSAGKNAREQLVSAVVTCYCRSVTSCLSLYAV
jgi:Copine/C2 domain